MPLIGPERFNGGAITPPAGTVGLTITPVNPNGTGNETDALAIVLPQSTGPNFPNIYAIKVVDPNTSAVSFSVDNAGSVTIAAQSGESALAVHAATVTPDPAVARFFDHQGSVTLDVLENGQIVAPLLPTVDPHVAGSLWNSAGVLHVSAG